MTQEQIKNFNYRAFIMLVQRYEHLTNFVKRSGYNPNDLFIDVKSQSQNLNGSFKKVLLSTYRNLIEDENNQELRQEFEILSVNNPMYEGRNYRQEVREIEQDLSNDIKKELKRLGRTFSQSDDEPLESMTYDSTSDLEEIYPDGSVLFDDKKTTIFDIIDDGKIALYDAISLLDDLKKIK